MAVINFLLMNLIVILCSFWIAYKIFRFDNLIDSLLAWSMVYFVLIVLSELFLGFLGLLTFQNVIFINLALFLIIWLITKARSSSFNIKGINNQISHFLENRIIFLGVAVILGFGLVKVGINLINPPFGWDSLNYHFTFPVEWLKYGNLVNPITIFDDPSPTYYPINGSLFYFWLILPLKSVFLADLGQVPFFILAFLATYSISRKLGLSKEYSFYAASLFLLTPNFFKQLQVAYVDVMVAALFLTCVNFLFALNEKFNWQNALVYSLSLGLLLGTKTVALPYSVLLFIPFLVYTFRGKKRFHLFLISISIIIVLGGFSYIRNFIDTGNPLYPFDLNLMGKTIFKGVMDSSTYGAHFNIDDYRLTKLFFHEGLGAQALIFVLPGMLFAIPAIILRKQRLNFNLAYFFILPILIYLIFRFILPLGNTRYLYPLLGVSMISGFYLANNLNIPRKLINVLVVICILASMSELAKRQELVTSIAFSILLFFAFKPIFNTIRGFIKKPVFLILFSVFSFFGLVWLNGDYIKYEYPRYLKMTKYSGFWPDATRAWNWLNSHTKGDNVAYAGRPVPFPLYGTNFKNNVYYVSVNKTDPAKLNYFSNSNYKWGYDFLSLHQNLEAKGNYRSDADYPVWLKNLLRRKTDYLFVYSLHQTKDILFPMEDAWAKTNPNVFEPVFVNEIIHIYKIIKKRDKYA